MNRLLLRNIGPIREADIPFADLTVFVGPQASGKSITLQWVKLLCDTGRVQQRLSSYGLDWGGKATEFLDLYFGEGMKSLLSTGDAGVAVDGKAVDFQRRLGRKQRSKTESVFYIPAQRVLALRDGWPRPFSDFSPGDPYVVRAFSDELRLLMEKEITKESDVFPSTKRLKSEYKSSISETLFSGFRLRIDKIQSRRRLVLTSDSNSHLPFMVWSAGQREFVPLLLGLYWLLPSAKISRRDKISTVIIEELEMGLHPKAINTVLLLVLELLWRGYRVLLATHSPQVLEFMWALRMIQKCRGKVDDVFALLGVTRKTLGLKTVAGAVFKKSLMVHYFEPHGDVTDISGLDPGSGERLQATWGGLTESAERANATVAGLVANAP